jgi:hypothetical protein
MRVFLTAGLLLLLAGGATAQPPEEERDLTRYEAMLRQKRFEAAWEKHDAPSARKRAIDHLEPLTTKLVDFRDIGRAFDHATFALQTDDEPSPTRQWVWSLCAVPEVRVIDGSAKELSVTIQPLYPVKGNIPKGLEVQLWFTNKQVTTFKPDKLPVKVKIPLPPLGDFKGLDRKLYFLVEAGRELRYTTIGVSQVADLKTRLVALKKAVESWDKVDSIEKATVRERAELLTSLVAGAAPRIDHPAADLLANAETMLDGKPFYTAAKPGQFWMSVPTDAKKAIATRAYVPRGLDAKKPVPVVVALHDANGSENQFFDTFGNGHIVTECRKRGWLLVAPRSGLGFVRTEPPVLAVLEKLAKRYPIDLKRVFIVGQAMGATQALDLAEQHPDKFAAIAALGGGRILDAKTIAHLPIFVGIGKRDGFQLKTARLLGKELKDAGAKRLTYKEYPDIEHIVVVREALPDVFEMFDQAAGK